MTNYDDFQINYENLLAGLRGYGHPLQEYDICNDSQKLVIAGVDTDRDEFYQIC